MSAPLEFPAPEMSAAFPLDGGLSPTLPLLIPGFDLVQRIASGSTGDLWLGRASSGRWRAVKLVFRDRFFDETAFERAWSGVQIAEGFSSAHPNLTQVLRSGRSEDDGCFYYVVELADDLNQGESVDPRLYAPSTLREELSQPTALSVDRCLAVARALAQGLAYLHDLGLVHGNIKSSNITFVGGVPKLGNFECLSLNAPRRNRRQVWKDSPLRLSGRPEADLHALGIVIFEMIWGSAELSHFPGLPALPSDFPEALDRLRVYEALARACDPESRVRYASGHELFDQLNRVRRPGIKP